MSHTNPFTDHALASGYDGWFETPLGQAADRLEQALIWRLAQPCVGERALDVGTATWPWPWHSGASAWWAMTPRRRCWAWRGPKARP
jgi:hypothetical protein